MQKKYLASYKQMISLRGLTDHTIKSYCTYLRAYLNYLDSVLHKLPEEVSWEEIRFFILWIQQQRSLADRTVNTCISQLRFFTLYVLHLPWDSYQLPMRKFNYYLPFVPSKDEVLTFISTMPNLKHKAMTALMYSAGLRIGEVCCLKYKDIDRCIAISNSRIKSVTDTHITFTAKDYRTNETNDITVTHVEFIRRFLMHVLPSGFQKIRYYGFLNNRYKKVNLKLICRLMGKQLLKSLYTGLNSDELLLALWNINVHLCPNCGCDRSVMQAVLFIIGIRYS